jgi:hypothetical protein
MKAAIAVILLVLPMLCAAKSDTARIEISKGRRALVTLEGPETAGAFTIWNGPLTQAGVEGDMRPTGPGPMDFFDWQAGAVEPPRGVKALTVRFYCAARAETPREQATSHLCYGVRYVPDPYGKGGYIQIPALRDRQFPMNTAIAHGVEGSWFRSTKRWEEVVRPRIDAALYPRREYGDYHDDYRYRQQRPYIYRAPSSSNTAVRAKPLVVPKSR